MYIVQRSVPLASGGSAVIVRIEMYTVYVIFNQEHSKTYTGQTEDLPRRLAEHNTHTFKGYTARFTGEWTVIYSESASTRLEALKREKQLKSGNGRAFIKNYIPA